MNDRGLPISRDWTKTLKQTDSALRARLAARRRRRTPAAEGAQPASLADVAPAKDDGHALTDLAVGSGVVVEPRDIVALPFAKPDVPASPNEPAVLPPSFLPLSILDRIAQPSKERDLTFRYAVLIVLLLHAGTLAGAVELAKRYPNLDDLGQVDNPKAIAVELSEAPDANATEKAGQIGEAKPPEPVDKKKDLTEAAAQQAQGPPQQAQLAQPEQKQSPPQQQQEPPKQQEPEQQQSPKPPEKQAMLQQKEQAERQSEKKTEKPPLEQPKQEKALKFQQTEDGTEAPAVEYDFAAGDPAVRVSANPAAQASEAQEAREARSPNQSDTPPNVAQQRLAASLQGKESGYRKAVLKKLALSKPQIWLNAAEVRITFVVSPGGEPVRIRLLQSSNDPFFDDVALEWIKRARFAPPPPDARPEDLVYLIHYTIH